MADTDSLDHLFSLLKLDGDQDSSHSLSSALSEHKDTEAQFWKLLPENPVKFLHKLEKVDPDLKEFVDLILKINDRCVVSVYKGVFTACSKQLAAIARSSSTAKDKNSGARYLAVILRFISRSCVELSEADINTLVPIVSLYLDRRLNRQEIISPSVIIISKCLISNAAATIDDLTEVIDSLVTQDTLDTLILAFSIVTVVFNMDSEAGRQLFSLDQLQSQQFSRRHFLSEELVTAALESLSSACVDKQSRALVASNFESVVKSALDSQKLSVKLLSASILVKTKATSETNDKEDFKLLLQLSDIFEQSVASHQAGDSLDEDFYGVALEGLAYTSLMNDVKELIIKNDALLKNLAQTLEKDISNPPLIYSALTILNNLTLYAPRLSEEQQKLSDLKNYAGNSSLANKAREPDSHVASRCKRVLDLGISTILSKVGHQLTATSKATVASLFRNLVTEKAHRQVFAKEGGLALIIYFCLPSEKGKGLDKKAACIAGSALAKTLISINPSIALSSKISILVTVPILLDQLNNEYSDLPLLDSFEALLALTNVAAIDEKCRDSIMIKGWTTIENLWSSNNHMIQRASVELICNLAWSPYCAEKFLDGSKQANSRLEMLSIFTDVESADTQRAAAGALALLAEWDPAAAVMSRNTKLLDKLVKILNESKDESFVLRAASALSSIISGEDSDVDQVRHAGAKEALSKLIAQPHSEEPEINSVAQECLEALS